METSPLRSKQPKMSLEEFYAFSEGPPYYEFDHLAESGRYEVTACMETGQIFCPGVFEGLEIDLAALMGDEPPDSESR